MFTAADSGSATTADRVPELSRRIAGLQRRRARAELDQHRRQHLEDHAARLHAIFRESVLQRSAAAAAAPGRLSGHVLPDREHRLSECARAARGGAERELFGLYRRQRMGMFRPLPVQPGRPHRRTPGRTSLRPRAIRAASPPAIRRIAGDIEVLDFEQFSTSKLRISCVDTANHIVYLTGPTGISANQRQRGRLHRRQPISGGKRSGPAHAARAVVLDRSDHSVDAHLSGQSRRESEHRHRDHSPAPAGAGGVESAIRNVSGTDVRARQLHLARRRTCIDGTGTGHQRGGVVPEFAAHHVRFRNRDANLRARAWSSFPASTDRRRPTAFPPTSTPWSPTT